MSLSLKKVKKVKGGELLLGSPQKKSLDIYLNKTVESGSVTSKDIIGWVVSVLISLVPLLIFYLKYRTDKKKSKEKLKELENMLYKQENKILKRENEELKRENEELKKKLAEETEKKSKEQKN